MKLSEFEYHRGNRLLCQRLAELRRMDPAMGISMDARPYAPLAVVVLDGLELLVDPLRLIRRTDDP